MAGHGASDSGITQALFEAQRREIAISMLKKADDFIAWDLDFNKKITDLMGLMVERIREKPSILDSSLGGREFFAERAAAKPGEGTSGGDIVGGVSWDDVFSVIEDLLTGEKKFIIKVIEFLLGMPIDP